MWRALLLALVVALGLLAGPGVRPADAHAYLTATSPADGASLGTAPTHLRLEFSEHVVPEATHVVVTDAAGHSYPVTGLRAEAVATGSGGDEGSADEASAEEEGTEVVDTEEPLALVADLPALSNGAYHVQWETLSSDDLHRTAGGFAFGINTTVVADSAGGVAETPPDLLDAIGRWGVYGGLAIALGAVLVRRLLGSSEGRGGRLSSRLRTVGAAGALAAAAIGAVWFALELARVGGSAITGSYAARWTVREAALLLLALVIAKGARPVWTAAVALLAALGTVLLGHTGLRGGPTWTVASALHLWAGAAWFGTVAVLAWLALRHRTLGLTPTELRATLRRFFRPAAVLVVLVAVTGLYLAGDVVVSVDAVVGTTYGRVLLAKVLVVTAAGLLAAVTSRRLHRPHPIDSAPFPIERAPFPIDSAVVPIDSAPFPIESAVVPIESAARRRIGLEAIGLGIALALAAVLASGQPAVSPALVDSGGPAPSRILDRTADSLQVTLVVAPNHPGDSVVTVDVFDARRPAPGPVTGVDIAVRPATGSASSTSATAHRVSQYRWAAGVPVSRAGSTPITVTIHRQGMSATTTTLDWVVGSTGATPARIVSRAPVSGVLQTAALVLLLAIGLLLARLTVVELRRRHTTPRRVIETCRHFLSTRRRGSRMAQAAGAQASPQAAGAQASPQAAAAQAGEQAAARSERAAADPQAQQPTGARTP